MFCKCHHKDTDLFNIIYKCFFKSASEDNQFSDNSLSQIFKFSKYDTSGEKFRLERFLVGLMIVSVDPKVFIFWNFNVLYILNYINFVIL